MRRRCASRSARASTVASDGVQHFRHPLRTTTRCSRNGLGRATGYTTLREDAVLTFGSLKVLPGRNGTAPSLTTGEVQRGQRRTCRDEARLERQQRKAWGSHTCRHLGTEAWPPLTRTRRRVRALAPRCAVAGAAVRPLREGRRTRQTRWTLRWTHAPWLSFTARKTVARCRPCTRKKVKKIPSRPGGGHGKPFYVCLQVPSTFY